MPSKADMLGWLRFAVAVVAMLVGAIFFVWQSQAAQNGRIEANNTQVQMLDQQSNGLGHTMQKIGDNISALSAQVSQVQISVGKIETMQAVQGEDIRELKETLRGR